MRVRLGVEEKAAGVHADLVHEVRERERLARALGDLDDLIAAHEAHHLHDEEVELAALEPQRGRAHGRGEADGVAVVVRAPNVDDAVKAALDEFVAVVGNVDRVVRIKPVRAAQDLVLVGAEVGVAQPECAVLFIRQAGVHKQLHGLGHVAGAVQAALEEPLVKMNAVAFEVALHARNVIRQAVGHKRRAALGARHGEVLVAVALIDQPGKLLDVIAVIAVVRKRDGVLALDELEVARLDGLAEQVDLIAGVVDVELTPDVVARAVEHGRECVAQHAAARVADRHGPGRVGGHELHHDLLAVAVVHAAIVRAGFVHCGQHVLIPLVGQAEVQKARSGRLDGGKPRAVQIHVRDERLGDLARGHVHGLGRRHGVVGSKVAVCGVLRLLDGAANVRALGQVARRSGTQICFPDARIHGGACLFDSIGHNQLPSIL